MSFRLRRGQTTVSCPNLPRMCGQLNGDIPRILIADDDRDVRLVLVAILEAAGYEASEAANGIEALRVARADRPDLILLDLSMPKMDGMETIRRLKSDPATASIPVVMVTASGDEDMARAAVAAGAFAYVVKPWDNNQIEQTVEAALRDRTRA